MIVIDKEVKVILDEIKKAGYEVAVVGGAVRNILLKNPIDGWDLTTNATPEDLLKIFPEAHYTNRFGTVLVPIKSQKLKDIVEVTTYRTESGYSDSRHPDKVVWGKTLEEDLARRDFTINAIGIPASVILGTSGARTPESSKVKDSGPFDNTQGKQARMTEGVVDPYGGQEDLKNKIVRAVGDPDARFREDALRMMRAVRFAATLGFEIEEKTMDAIKKNANKLSGVSGERIREELFKVVASDNVDLGMFLFRKSGLLKIFMPEMDECFGVEQVSPKRHHIFDVGTHCVMSAKHCPSSDVIVRFAAMLHDIGKAKVAKVTDEGVRTFYNHEVAGSRVANKICDRLHLSKDQKEKIFKLVRWHQFSVGENQTDSAVRRFINNVGIDKVEDMIAVRIGDRLGSGLTDTEGWRLKLFRQRIKDVLKQPFTVKDLKINGRDVMKELGLKPGPKVGEILNKLFEEVLADAKKNEREYLLNRLEEFK